MDISNLLHTLTTQGLRLSLGKAPETIAVVGPVASLTLEQQRALAEHKQTLLSMLTPLPTCFILHCGEAEEREATQFADSDSPEAMAALCDAMEYFERLTDAKATHCPERLVQTVLEPGQQESPCPRCGNSNTYLAILHTGESLRRDCAICGRFVEFPNWHNREATAKILAAAIAGSRYNSKASCLSAGNTQASSDDLLSLEKETANGQCNR